MKGFVCYVTYRPYPLFRAFVKRAEWSKSGLYLKGSKFDGQKKEKIATVKRRSLLLVIPYVTSFFPFL